MKFHLILLAGGRGSRMPGSVPKQLQNLAGRPVIYYSLTSFLKWSRASRVIVVSLDEIIDETARIIKEVYDNLDLDHNRFSIVKGGASRHQSVLAGIEEARKIATGDDLLFIHDAARPIIEESELNRLADRFLEDDSCLIASLVSNISETIVCGASQDEKIKLPGRLIKCLDRSKHFVVKTPQALRFSAIDKLLQVPENESFTDLLTWSSAAGLPATLLEAGARNIKLTEPFDFHFFEQMIKEAPVI